MDYRAAVAYIESFTNYERTGLVALTGTNYDLGRVEELLRRLGNPHLGAKTVHIAGTKGKGSTAAMVASALHCAGYRTGLFTSPHLHSWRERICLDGVPISEEDWAAATEKVRAVADIMQAEARFGALTTFDLLLALALVYFREKGVQIQVLETGLGGRLDSTNVVKGDVCVITSISLDHVEVLGDTLDRIAFEKAGIIKPGSIVVSSPQAPEAAAVIEETCRQKGATLIMVGKDITWHKLAADLDGQSFTVQGKAGSYNLRIPLLGDFQLENGATAVAALEALSASGIPVPSGSMAAGFSTVSWPGRLEILRHEPLLIVDGAHSIDSARKLRLAIEQYFDFARLILIIGTSTGHNMATIVEELVPISDVVIATRSRHPRAADPSALVAEFARHGLVAETTESVASAVEKALAMAGGKDLILATGSLFVVAETIEWAKGLRPEFD